MRRHTFVIRMWTEYQNPDPAAWRATVVDARTGDDRHLGSVDDLVEYLLGMTREAGPDGN